MKVKEIKSIIEKIKTMYNLKDLKEKDRLRINKYHRTYYNKWYKAIPKIIIMLLLVGCLNCNKESDELKIVVMYAGDFYFSVNNTTHVYITVGHGKLVMKEDKIKNVLNNNINSITVKACKFIDIYSPADEGNLSIQIFEGNDLMSEKSIGYGETKIFLNYNF